MNAPSAPSRVGTRRFAASTARVPGRTPAAASSSGLRFVSAQTSRQWTPAPSIASRCADSADT